MKFPKTLHVVIAEEGDLKFFSVAEGTEDAAIEPGQKIAIYHLQKIVTLKQRRWAE